MKKLLMIVLTLAMLLSMTACGGSSDTSASSDPKPSAPTATGESDAYPKAGTVATFYIGGSVGGGGDLNCRSLIRYLEPAMGITIVPENITGSRTIYNGIKKCVEAPADGYTFGFMLYPHVVTEQFDPNTKDNTLFLDDYYALCNLVSDSAVIAVRADDERFADVNDLSGLVDYMTSTGETLLISACSVGGDDDIAAHKLMLAAPEIADQLVIVNGEAVSDGLTSLLGGTLDIFTGNVGDVGTLVADGEIKVLSVFAEDRSVFLPDVPTAKECGYDLIASTSRGVCISKDTDPAVIAKLESILDEVVQDPAFIDEYTSQGFELNYMKHDEYEAWLTSEYENFDEIAAVYGW